MPRPLRAILAIALVGPLTAAIPAAADESAHWAVDNNQRRQELLHRSWPSDGVPGSVLVTAATEYGADDVAAREGGQRIGPRTVLLDVEPGTESDVAARVAGRGGVVGVEPDRLRTLAARPNDPRYGDQWSHAVAGAETAWNTTTGDPSVTVAVLDTGVNGNHEDLVENLIEQVDVSSGRVVGPSLGTNNDACGEGHGTFVAGIVGASGNNGTGLAGVAWDVSIIDIALTSPASRCGILDSAIIAGIDYATNQRVDGPVDVVNLSLGGIADSCPTAMQATLDDARDKGVLVIAASGNDQGFIDEPVSIPASCDGVMSVGAVGFDGSIAPYSNTNEHVDLVAPGGDTSVITGRGVASTTLAGSYGEFEGTSFAAPYVAGVAALLRSVDSSLTPDDLESILERTASDRGPAGRDIEYGWGMVNVAAAVQAALAGDPDPPVADPGFPVKPGAEVVDRVRTSGTTTEAIQQAVAMSAYTFEPDQAFHAVIARADDFADALAGSSLGFGLGPLLFSTPTGGLPSVTANELQRAVAPGATVYLLGGSAALPPTLEDEVAALGYVPRRVAGTTRQETSVAIAEQLESFLVENGFDVPPVAMVATAYNWPDAVSAGSMGAWFGFPILVTSATDLDAPVDAFLSSRSWSNVYVVGGTAAISEDVRRAARDAARLSSGDTPRLAGNTRSGTTVAVSAEFELLYSEQFEAIFGIPAVPNVVAAVNLRRADGFAHVLSASMLVGAYAGVFVPVEGETGTEITPDAQSYVCRFPANGVVVGGGDLISAEISALFDQLLRGSAPACTA